MGDASVCRQLTGGMREAGAASACVGFVSAWRQWTDVVQDTCRGVGAACASVGVVATCWQLPIGVQYGGKTGACVGTASAWRQVPDGVQGVEAASAGVGAASACRQLAVGMQYGGRVGKSCASCKVKLAGTDCGQWEPPAQVGQGCVREQDAGAAGGRPATCKMRARGGQRLDATCGVKQAAGEGEGGILE